MKKLINLIFAITVLSLFSGCAKPVLETTYLPEPPPEPPYSYEEEQKKAEQARKEQEAKIEAKRIARQQEEKRLAEEEHQKVLLEQRRVETLTKVRKSIDAFQEAIQQGSCSKAERRARKLLDSAHSEDNRLEADLMTSTCLCYLIHDADVTRYNQCSSELKQLTADQRFLDRETQLVLSLQPHFKQKNQRKRRDPRIDLKLDQSVQSMLTNNQN